MVEKCECTKLTLKISEEQWAKVDEIIERNKNKPGALIPVLEQVQEVVGFLPFEVQQRISQGLNISPSMIYGVVTFYSFFSMVPKGKYMIRVCMGTACYVKRSEEILNKLKQELKIDVGEITEDGKYSIEGVRCVGACGLAPVVVINQNTHGCVDPVKVMKILEEYK